ncbi:LytR/AlgR family response regulator transcription factor [Spirosoma soli]|uniref:LytR/AlgR family response regulator transcription factor n=1 Tax=Spirosoma soli TaxID=1770529 RepID=A0ABW5MES3_9BACT
MNLSCLIVDDEPLAVQLLEGHIRLTPFLTHTYTCYHALEALKWLETNTVDLICLDINMPYLSGIQLKALLPAHQAVIFTTAYSDYAVESYELNAVDYLLKPVTFDRFLKSAMKARKALETPPSTPVTLSTERETSIYIKSGKDYLKVAYDDILYIEALKDYVTVVTATARIIAYKRLKDLEQSLPDQFSRVHLSYIVNRNCIQKVVANHIWIGTQQIPISDTYRSTFLQRIEQRLW